MNNSQNLVLSKSNFISIIIGAIVGIGFLALPVGVVKAAHQDGWISAFLGVIYPLSFIGLASYIIKKHPNESILFISKKSFGKILGSVFNFIYLTLGIFIACNVIRGYTNLMSSFIVPWVSPIKFIMLCTLIVAYAASKGLKVLGKICEVTLVMIIILSIVPIPALKVASLINIRPIFGSGISSILSGVKGSLLSYSGIEVIILFHPYVQEKTKIVRYSLVSITIVTILYTWGTFISIFYLSPDIVSKSQWPFVLATQSVTISIINNYSYFFLLMWGIVGIRCAVVFYCSSVLIITDFFPKLNKKFIYIVVYIIFVYFSIKVGNEIDRRAIIDPVMKVYTIINFIGLILICIILKFKTDENIAKKEL